MNMIPESNGLERLNMKQKISRVKLGKKIIFVIVFIVLSGFIFQSFSNFIGREKIEQSLTYAKIDNSRIEYQLKGTGDYTVVFDGAIATNLYQWNDIVDGLDKQLGVKTFIYNRNGYGFSDIKASKTPKEQAEELKILLRKAGVSGKLIFVGEEYGSLVATNFAKLYPESVAGMILIKPLNEEIVKSYEYKNNLKMDYYKSIFQTVGSYFGVTTVLDHFGLTYSVNGFEESLKEIPKEEYQVQKTKKNFRQAIQNEFESLYFYADTSQDTEILSGKPLYIITNDENETLAKLGSKDETTIYKTENTEKVISFSEKDMIINAINVVAKEVKRINKVKSN